MRLLLALLLAPALAGCLDGMPALLEGSAEDIVVAPSGDGFEASRLLDAEADAGPDVRLTLATFRGDVSVQEGEGPLRATLRVVAAGATPEEARAGLGAVAATLHVAGDEVVARADADPGSRARAEIRVVVPAGTRLTGGAESSEGGVRVRGLARDLALAAASGPVAGALRGEGALQLRAAGGAVEVALDPTGPARLDVEVRDGTAALTLREGPRVGYDLDAAAGGGTITSAMVEARLEGDGARATLRTPELPSRDVRVQGRVAVVDGSIHFEGG